MVSLTIPPSTATVKVHVIDVAEPGTVAPAASFLHPVLPGHENLSCPAFAFFVEHPATKQRLMFDLGVRKDPENFSPTLAPMFASGAFKITVEKDIADRLKEAGVPLETVNAVIWSHSHMDHIGDVSTFPSNTELIIGPGTDRKVYPEHKDAPLLESDFKGRKVTELTFTDNTPTIGGFQAYDYFGDGSLYLLNVPGHLPGHMAALARTTPTTFILLGGDACHHPGQLRPTSSLHEHFPCPGALLAATRHSISTEHFPSSSPKFEEGFDLASRTSPLLTIPEGHSSYADPATARESLNKMLAFDTSADVFILIAHDQSLHDVLEMFPADLNAWQDKGWKERATWAFVDETNPAFRFKPREYLKQKI